MTKKPLDSIKSGRFARGLALAKLSSQAAAKLATHAVGGLFAPASENESRALSLLRSQAEALASELGQLKGSLMKAGQMLSVYGENLLPPEINTILKSLQSQSPPLAWPAIERELRAGLGEKLDELEVDPTPHASASLGQVHLARIRSSGEQIALKVQYPGVDQAIESDLRTLKRLLSISRLLPQGPRFDALFDEVRIMLEQEVDYSKELALTELYRERVGSDPRFRLPQVYARYCTPRILATSFEKGVGVDSPEVLALSQERRNAIGIAVLELYLKELFEFRLVQTDPHFGNFRVRLAEREGEPDVLVLLDFGATLAIAPEFLRSYRRMVIGSFRGVRSEVEAGAIEMGFLKPSDSAEAKAAFYDFCRLLVEPWTVPGRVYDFGATDLPRRVLKDGAALAKIMGLRPPPREVVFIDRKVGGVFVFLSTLKTRFDGHALMARYLSD